MRDQDFTDTDSVLEYAATLIEETSILDMGGIFAKRKRVREDAELRHETAKNVRKRCAEHIRAMKARPDLSPLITLRRLSEMKDDRHHAAYLRDAWPLAWKGWVDIEATIKCNSNQIPPETEYRIRLTDKGRELLATEDATPTAKGRGA